MNIKPTKRTKSILRVTLLITTFTLAFFAIKNIEHKSTIIIDTKELECYSNCNATSVASDDTSLVEDIQNFKLAIYKQNLAERKKIAEEEHLVELEAKRIAKQKADEEGKKEYVAVSRGNDYKGVNENIGTFNVSWYTSDCKGCTGITSTTYDVRKTIYYNDYGVAASDWSVIPPYSIIEVEGYGKFIVLDKGGLIKGRKLDLLISTTKEADYNGRQNLNVTILRWGKTK